MHCTDVERHEAKHYEHNSSMDTDAVPLYLGQVLNDPARDTWPTL